MNHSRRGIWYYVGVNSARPSRHLEEDVASNRCSRTEIRRFPEHRRIRIWQVGDFAEKPLNRRFKRLLSTQLCKELGCFRTRVRDIWEELEEMPEPLFTPQSTPKHEQTYETDVRSMH